MKGAVVDLERLGWLSEDEARRYVERFEPRSSMEDPRIGMDLDPEDLSRPWASAEPGLDRPSCQ